MLINSYILSVKAFGHLYELNHCKLKIYDVVLTGRATGFVNDMQICHFCNGSQFTIFSNLQHKKNPNLWQFRWSNFHLYQK